MNIKTYLEEKRALIDKFLKEYFSFPSELSVLHEAMRYSLFAGGKRIRPILALASYEICRGNPEDILPQASAIELIHTYSLIHDDLPAMDNDDLRRGRPTSHKVFGEAMAILAGDALLTEAFYMMTNTTSNKSNPPLPPFSKRGRGGFLDKEIKPSSLIKVVREVARAAGIHGMVGGQAQDILSENSEPDSDTLHFIHLHKTAALITASVRVGAILANCSKLRLNNLTRYGENIGLAFQIVDDILDIEGSTEELGKTAGSDVKKKKMTYPSLFDIKESKKKAEKLIKDAIYAIKDFSGKADPLREIAWYLIKRRF
jgi:geranylgeranyl diphosphate synthase type II